MNTAIDTRSRILDAALASFLEHGYEATTVARIREASGVSNGALFHHFRSKDAIAAALYAEALLDFQRELWRILDARPTTLRDGIDAIVGHHLRWVQVNPDRARFLYQAGRLTGDCEPMRAVERGNSELLAAYAAWYAPLVTAGEAREVQPGLVIAIVGGPAHEVCRRWLAGDRTRDLTRHAGELARAAWAGLAGPVSLGTAEAPPPARATLPSVVRLEVYAADGTVLGTSEARVSPPASDLP